VALKFGKRDIARIVDVIDREYATAEEAAEAALVAAYEVIKAKAKFTVVGQLATIAGEKIPVDDPRAEKVALGWYGTEKQALDDALRLFYSTQTHETHRAWVLPIHNDTPSAYYVGRKKHKQAEAAADVPARERTLAERIQWVEDNPGVAPPQHWGVEPARHRLSQCQACFGVGKVPILREDEEVNG
jgi:hypothetical protein